MSKLLHTKEGDDTEKVKRLRQLLLNFLHYIRRPQGYTKVHHDSTPPARDVLEEMSTFEDNYDSLPSLPRSWGPPIARSTPIPSLDGVEMEEAIEAMTRRPEILTYSDQGQMIYRGVAIPDTDILDLLSGNRANGREIFNAGINEIRTPPPPPPPPQVVNTPVKSRIPPPPVVNTPVKSRIPPPPQVVRTRVRARMPPRVRTRGVKRRAMEKLEGGLPAKKIIIERKKPKRTQLRKKLIERKRREKVAKEAITRIKRRNRKRKAERQMQGPKFKKYMRINYGGEKLRDIIQKARKERVVTDKKRRRKKARNGRYSTGFILHPRSTHGIFRSR